MYSTTFAIKEFNIDTRNVTVLVKLENDVYAMDYDYNNRFLYFPRLNMHDIVRYVNVYTDYFNSKGINTIYSNKGNTHKDTKQP